MTTPLSPMASWAILLTIFTVIGLLALVAYLWIELRCARDAIGRLGTGPLWDWQPKRRERQDW